jgi:hypothetical protein
MHETHVQEIENVAVSLGSLKALLGLSQIEDTDWENISSILDEFSFKLLTSAAEIRSLIHERENDGHAPVEGEVTRTFCGNGYGNQ